MRPICLPVPGSSVSCWAGCGPWSRPRTPRTPCCGRSWLRSGSILRRGLELKVAELERRLGQDSTNSGTPGSKEGIGARERRKAERKKQVSERERSKDRKRGGQPGHPGAGLKRDPGPDERRPADPPARCSRCGTGLGGARPAEPGWAQVWDVRFARFVTGHLLPRRTARAARRRPGSRRSGGRWRGHGIDHCIIPCLGHHQRVRPIRGEVTGCRDRRRAPVRRACRSPG